MSEEKEDKEEEEEEEEKRSALQDGSASAGKSRFFFPKPKTFNGYDSILPCTDQLSPRI